MEKPSEASLPILRVSELLRIVGEVSQGSDEMAKLPNSQRVMVDETTLPFPTVTLKMDKIYCVSTWTPLSVRRWLLSKQHLSGLANHFFDLNVGGVALTSLQRDDLDALQVHKALHTALMCEIRILKLRQAEQFKPLHKEMESTVHIVWRKQLKLLERTDPVEDVAPPTDFFNLHSVAHTIGQGDCTDVKGERFTVTEYLPVTPGHREAVLSALQTASHIKHPNLVHPYGTLPTTPLS